MDLPKLASSKMQATTLTLPMAQRLFHALNLAKKEAE